MIRRSHFDPQRVREEIAIAAARMIAEDGLDYATAKRKAARQVVGETRIEGGWLPDNDQIEDEIREYQALFQGESQPAVLRRLREIALDWMKRLDAFQPFVTGAVLNGTAGEHSDIHLQIFCDNPKDVAIWLLNANVQYDVSETRHFAARGYVETLSFIYKVSRDEAPVGIHVALYDTDDLRGAVRADARGRLARASAPALQALIDEGDEADEHDAGNDSPAP
ncbi:UDP-N-acetylmuramate--alanine ligase [Paraburkholderia sp. J12]|uniref:UDP-N-acetylmuramate--alanine ligase n=1 Tax=Paraburkholderia sp. J12 TaxID=2805432 RepID=UPI002ABD25AA|nr:UDP-N-acetylmuramate--alanine ligase [Paraburkholderia sp. J12]